jgi:hypothetical protein
VTFLEENALIRDFQIEAIKFSFWWVSGVDWLRELWGFFDCNLGRSRMQISLNEELNLFKFHQAFIKTKDKSKATT